MKITDPNKTLEMAGMYEFIVDWEAGVVYLDNIQKLALAIITKLRKALALAHSMILGGEQHTEQSKQVIEGALGLR